MGPLPAGTLTLLFSDIEGSTSMLTRLGSRWAEALAAHRAILRAAFEQYDGHEMGTEGDSFFVVFPSAKGALLAAVTAQRGLADHDWPGSTPMRVRMGLHTGEPQQHEEGYVGLDVHRAARIAGIAHGGQVVLSASTRALLGDGPEGVTLRDLGLHRLKDLPEPEHLYDVVAPGLLAEHPPLRSLGMPANLPAYTTDLVGRSRELDELTEMILRGARLVTLTGPGGTGKTRLAVAVAGGLQDRFPHDVFFVPLATAARAPLMWAGIAEAVGAYADPDAAPVHRALGFLRDRAALLVLDNLEQIDDADVVVSRIMSEARDIRMLTTSRRPLHLVDEQQYPVPVLAVPAPDAARADAARASAVDLFVQRARMVKPGFTLTEDNAADVAALCRRLDGLPLAIELAAARSRLLGPRALLQRMDNLRLGEGPEGSHRSERQRTLAATIGWSYDLLTEEDQQVFRRLGVFSGAVGLDAVEQVIGSDDRDPLDVVAHLVDVSLLEIVEAADGEPMIYMLETIRRFARERLGESGELDDTRLRHTRWCVRVASDIEALLHGPRQMSALDRMDAVQEEVRAALDWALTPAEDGHERRSCAFALLKAMDTYWYRFGYLAEGRGWHERALALIDGWEGPDDPGIVDALHGHGVLAVQRNDLEVAADALERALTMARRLGDLGREARESNSLGITRREAGDVEAARALIERSLALARHTGNRQREATALTNLVHIHMDTGDYPGAVEAARSAAALDEALGDVWGKAINESNLAAALLHAEGPVPALDWLVEVAPRAVAMNDFELSIDVVESLATAWAALGEGERAATLLGTADEQRVAADMPRAVPDQGLLDRFLVPVREATDPTRWQDAYARGRTLSIEDAVHEGTAGAEALRSQAGARQAP